jgi:hypothetical protein
VVYVSDNRKDVTSLEIGHFGYQKIYNCILIFKKSKHALALNDLQKSSSKKKLGLGQNLA